jgi:hypothetical protein
MVIYEPLTGNRTCCSCQNASVLGSNESADGAKPDHRMSPPVYEDAVKRPQHVTHLFPPSSLRQVERKTRRIVHSAMPPRSEWSSAPETSLENRAMSQIVDRLIKRHVQRENSPCNGAIFLSDGNNIVSSNLTCFLPPALQISFHFLHLRYISYN